MDKVNIGRVNMSNSATKRPKNEKPQGFMLEVADRNVKVRQMDYTLNPVEEKVSELYYKIRCHHMTPILSKLA